MTEYILLVIIMVFIYFVLIRNRTTPKTDWETLPTLPEYQQIKKAKDHKGELCCQYCGHSETVQRALQSDKENSDKTKFYHACTQCKVVLWRTQSQ